MPTKKLWVFAALILILLLVNISIYQKEQHLAHGRTVCLALAPVDPRSLMQGDYMRLRFALNDAIRTALPKERPSSHFGYKSENRDGYALLRLESNCTAEFLSLAQTHAAQKNSVAIHYRVRNGRVKIATNAFFFQEGTGKHYDKAAYGVFKVNKQGEPLLVGLRDKSLNDLK